MTSPVAVVPWVLRYCTRDFLVLFLFLPSTANRGPDYLRDFFLFASSDRALEPYVCGIPDILSGMVQLLELATVMHPPVVLVASCFEMDVVLGSRREIEVHGQTWNTCLHSEVRTPLFLNVFSAFHIPPIPSHAWIILCKGSSIHSDDHRSQLCEQSMFTLLHTLGKTCVHDKHDILAQPIHGSTFSLLQQHTNSPSNSMKISNPTVPRPLPSPKLRPLTLRDYTGLVFCPLCHLHQHRLFSRRSNKYQSYLT